MPHASPTATTTAEQGRRAGTEREGLHILVWGQLGQVTGESWWLRTTWGAPRRVPSVLPGSASSRWLPWLTHKAAGPAGMRVGVGVVTGVRRVRSRTCVRAAVALVLSLRDAPWRATNILPPAYPGCPGGLLTSPKSRFRPKLLLQMLLARREGQKGTAPRLCKAGGTQGSGAGAVPPPRWHTSHGSASRCPHHGARPPSEVPQRFGGQPPSSWPAATCPRATAGPAGAGKG